jgi:hypothetical protein
MGGRVRRKTLAAIPLPAPAADSCALCDRALGRRVERHHPIPRSEGGRATVPLHPICHRAIHALFETAELARIGSDLTLLREEAALRPFLKWIADKPPDFHAPTHRSKR